MKAMKKTVAILLCLVMCLSMLPTWALAEAPVAPETDAALISEEPTAEVMQEPIPEEVTPDTPPQEPSEVVPEEAVLQEEIPEPEEQVNEEPEPENETYSEAEAVSDEGIGEEGTAGNDTSPVEESSEVQPNTVTNLEEAGEALAESSESPTEPESAADPAAENPEAAEAVTVIFRITPENAELIVYTKDNPDHPGEKTVLDPEEDGSYLLLPGEYSYTLIAEGYVTVEEETLLVVPSEEPVKVETVMMPADEELSEEETEEAVLQAEEAETEASNEAIAAADAAKDETAILMASSGTCGDNLTWSLNSGTLTISGTGAMTNYSQSSNVTTAPWGSNVKKVRIEAGVTSIGSYAFYRCSSLTDVAIPDTVTSIGNYAFEGCSILAGIEIPASVMSIGSAAFDNCNGITELRIPQSVTSIKSYAFSQCKNLKVVEFAGKPGEVSSYIFSGCSSLESIKMPIIGTALNTLFSSNSGSVPTSLKTVEIIESTMIPSDYFPSGSGITSIKLPNTLKSIGTYAFSGCRSLSSLTIPYGVTSIGDGAFINCSSLSKLTIPESVTTIGTMNGGEIFSGCTELKTAGPIGSGCNYEYGWTNAIVSKAFDGCDQLASIVFPAGVTSIGSYAFYHCRSLTDVAIPDTVTNIGNYAFEGCSVLAEIEIPESVTSIGTAAFDNCKGITELRIPQSVTSIGSAAFSQCTSLRTVEFMGKPGDVKSNIFSSCSSLERIKMPIIGTALNTLFSSSSGSVPTSLKTVEIIKSTTIPSSYFSNCSGITSLILPDNLTSIGSSAFSGCRGLSSFTIPSRVTSIGNNAFTNCSNLSTVYLYSSIDGKNIGSGAFSSSPITDIYYPFESVSDSVKAAFPSDAVWHLSSMGSGGSGINWYMNVDTGTLVLSGNGRMDSFAESRPWDAYRASIRNVVIENGITAIGENAFSEYKNLKSIELPLSITAVGAGAFYGCASFTDVYYTDGSQVYRSKITVSGGNDPFENAAWHYMDFVADGACGDLIWIILNDGTLMLKDSDQMPDFSIDTPAPWSEYKDIITAVQMNEQISRIGDYAFAGFSQMPRYTIPGNITELGTAIFYGSDVKELVFGVSMPSISENSLMGATLTALYPGESDSYTNTNMLPYGGNSTWIAYFNGNPEENYYVSYDRNGGEYAPERQVKYYATDLQLCPEEAQRTGYDFLGWAENADAEVAAYQPQEFISKNENVTLYAVWSQKTFSIEFDANGGTDAPVNLTKQYGVELQLPTEKPVRDGYDFVGWATDQAATSALYQAGDFYTENRNIRLYAVWKIWTYTVRYDANGGSGAPGTQIKNYGKTLTLSATVPTRIGHSFQGWDTSANGVQVVYRPGGQYTANENADLHAVWKKNKYHLNYDANGGSGAPAGITAEYQTVLRISSTVPSREYYEFAGWATNKEAETVQYQAGDTMVLESEQTLYAVWRRMISNSGSCGNSVTWTQYADGELTLTGSGTVDRYQTAKPWNTETVKKVWIGASVTDVGEGLFSDCSDLTEYVVENGSTTYSAVNGVLYSKDLKKLISCPPGKTGNVQVQTVTTSIANDAFLNCALSSVSIPSGMKTIGDTAFCRCKNLTEISLPDSVTSIGSGAFARCSKLTSVKLPQTITIISQMMFYGCTALTDLSLPASLRTIKGSAFFDCDSLFEIQIPSGVTSIENSALSGCDNLLRVVVAQGNSKYTSDDRGIVYSKDMTRLVLAPGGIAGNVDIPETVATIGETGFYLCGRVSSIHFPASVRTIERYAFSGCSALTDVYRDIPVWKTEAEALYISSNNEPLENANWHYLENVAEGDCNEGLHWILDQDYTLVIQGTGEMPDYADASSPWYAYRDKIKAIILPNGLTRIGSYAFQGCILIGEISLPTSLISLGEYSFCSCIGLTDITIPENVKMVDDYAFSNCTGLSAVTIREGVERLGDGVFRMCSGITEIVLPASITELGGTDFHVPEMLFAANSANNAATVTWKNVTGATGYEIQYSTMRDFSKNKNSIVSDTTAISTTLNNLTKGEQYHIRIRSYQQQNETVYLSSWSQATAVTIDIGITERYSEVTGFKVTVGAVRTLVASWDAVPGASGYSVQYQKNQKGDWTDAGNIRSTSLSWSVEALVPYNSRVRAYQTKEDGSIVYGKWTEPKAGIYPKQDIATAYLYVNDVAYTGTALEPMVQVVLNGEALIRNRDYSISYMNNIYPGTATFTLIGMGEYFGEQTGSFNISQPAGNTDPQSIELINQGTFQTSMDLGVLTVTTKLFRDLIVAGYYGNYMNESAYFVVTGPGLNIKEQGTELGSGFTKLEINCGALEEGRYTIRAYAGEEMPGSVVRQVRLPNGSTAYGYVGSGEYNYTLQGTCTLTITHEKPQKAPELQGIYAGIMTPIDFRSFMLSVNPIPANAPLPTLNWYSSNTAVATVQNGIVTVRKAGSFTITVYMNQMNTSWWFNIDALDLKEENLLSYDLDQKTATVVYNNQYLKENVDYEIVSSGSSMKIVGKGLFQGTVSAGTTKQFTDVANPDEYFYDPVYWAVDRGITTGRSDTTFDPYGQCTRGHIVTFLWRAFGEQEPTISNPFTDVKESDSFYKAVLWAYENGITTGQTATTFGPWNFCTRGQIVTFLWRAMGQAEPGIGNPFTDVNPGDGFYRAVLWAVENGITTGRTPTTFDPWATCTRGQAVTFLYRAMHG